MIKIKILFFAMVIVLFPSVASCSDGMGNYKALFKASYFTNYQNVRYLDKDSENYWELEGKLNFDEEKSFVFKKGFLDPPNSLFPIPINSVTQTAIRKKNMGIGYYFNNDYHSFRVFTAKIDNKNIYRLGYIYGEFTYPDEDIEDVHEVKIELHSELELLRKNLKYSFYCAYQRREKDLKDRTLVTQPGAMDISYEEKRYELVADISLRLYGTERNYFDLFASYDFVNRPPAKTKAKINNSFISFNTDLDDYKWNEISLKHGFRTENMYPGSYIQVQIGHSKPSYYDYDVDFISLSIPLFENKEQGLKIVGGGMQRNVPDTKDKFYSIGLVYKFKIY